MKIFSKQRFIEAEGNEVYLKCKAWVDMCDGKRVEQGEVNGWLSDKAWEIIK